MAKRMQFNMETRLPIQSQFDCYVRNESPYICIQRLVLSACRQSLIQCRVAEKLMYLHVSHA